MTDSTQLDIAHLRTWIGTTQSVTERLCAFPAKAWASTLDIDDSNHTDINAVPPLWHWLYFLPINSLANTGNDGHATRGEFLPPVPLPRRMWAGSRLRFLAPITIGQMLNKRSVVQSVEHKSGRSGELVFVTVRHEISDADTVLLEEEHDIVYRQLDAAPASQRAASKPVFAERANYAFERSFQADAVLLFRYSALTFNSHRIHYDHPYATNVEGYEGLVVHGPLIATLLLDLLRREQPERQVKGFTFRNISPVFDHETFFLRGMPMDDGVVHLWAQRADGGMIMDATAQTS